MLDPQRTISALRELQRRTGDAQGAQRVAYTAPWHAARGFLTAQLAELPVTVDTDPAGNLWATLPGASDQELWIGGHLDSVPNGGWLDGCLNVFAGLEVLRRLSEQYDGRPPVTVRLVDWADEEGRFGHSLYGSSAVSGHLDPQRAATLTDREGVTMRDALAGIGVDLQHALKAGTQRQKAVAYIELHIEQGPVLERQNLPLGAVLGTCGVERHRVTVTGRAAHAGSTPMDARQDALLVLGRLSQAVYAWTAAHGGVSTIGSVTTTPGIPTSVVETCTFTLDQRHLDPAGLAALWDHAQRDLAQFSADAGCTFAVSPLFQIEPVPFHPALIGACEQAILDVTPQAARLPSGPLHDAAEVARAGIPTVMLFVQSLGGLSHNAAEDTLDAHLDLSVRALDRLAERTITWIRAAERHGARIPAAP
ncbi:Zn-dependent hydrolase [Deinococcus arenae]|uniref:Zn-dependent hydrolase n=1 Tax=Deinococcus arenae TaxID=1452751 RepID=A0A8H9LAQ6_9DEIO|nr:MULTISPECIES: hydantoinase/carbamoylase family amidase [Deinococcus]GGM60319.1 Zn-dependent hydrolase [Deinococcus arenae]